MCYKALPGNRPDHQRRQVISDFPRPADGAQERGRRGKPRRGSAPTNIGDCTLPDVHPDFEPDGAANLGSVLLQAMLSEKELTGFQKNYETPGVEFGEGLGVGNL